MTLPCARLPEGHTALTSGCTASHSGQRGSEGPRLPACEQKQHPSHPCSVEMPEPPRAHCPSGGDPVTCSRLKPHEDVRTQIIR